jgi:hypothetical protein
MRMRGYARACVWMLLLGVCGVGRTQSAPAISPETETDAELHAMSRMAAVIFTGRVVALRRAEASNGATGVVEIEFAVEDAICGVSGGSYVLREWAGAWTAGNEPLRPGHRYLMLLHAPGRAGLSSPVGGADGAIPIRGGEPAGLGATGETSAGGGTSPGTGFVDLGWVAMRAVRPVSYAVAGAWHASPQLGTASQAGRTARVDIPGLAPTTARAPERATLADVVGLLRSWEQAGHAIR